MGGVFSSETEGGTCPWICMCLSVLKISLWGVTYMFLIYNSEKGTLKFKKVLRPTAVCLPMGTRLAEKSEIILHSEMLYQSRKITSPSAHVIKCSII